MSTASPSKIDKPRMVLSLARIAIEAAHAEAERDGSAIAVAVADADGELVALEKQDAATGISPYLAISRARDAVLWQASFDQAADHHHQGRRGPLPGMVVPEGGASFKANGVVIGGIGISGTDRSHSSRIAAITAKAIEQQIGQQSQIIPTFDLTLLDTPMQGYQITFFTQQDRMHGNMPLAQWLLDEARKQGIRGGTLDGALQGFGHDGNMCAINMFDFSDMPVQIMLVVTAEEADRMFAHLEREQLRLFYVKVPVEFGAIGAA